MTTAAIIISILSILSSIILLLMFFILGAMAKKIKVLKDNILSLVEVNKEIIKMIYDLYKKSP